MPISPITHEMLYGCLPSNEESVLAAEVCAASAVPLSQLYLSGDMPVIAWDEEVQEWLRGRWRVIADMDADCPGCHLPWNVARERPLYYSQGAVGSCCGHAFGFAYESSILTNMALRSGQEYHRINPIGTYVLSHGGKMKNGQNVSIMAKYCNKKGNFLVADIGTENQKCPQYSDKAYENALKNQSAVMFLPHVEAVMDCLRGGVAVACGNSVAVSSTKIDGRGFPVAELSGHWAHATHFAGWTYEQGHDYYSWINSYGAMYKKGKRGETGDGAWFTEDLLRKFLKNAWEQYGAPVAVFTEGRKS